MENEAYDKYSEETESEQVLNEILENMKQVDLIKQNLKDYEKFMEILECSKEIPESVEEIARARTRR